MKNKGNMSLKDYREQPDAGLYEKIERRLRIRRWARVGVVAAVTIVAVMTVVLAFTTHSKTEGENVYAQVVDMPNAAIEEAQRTVSPSETTEHTVHTERIEKEDPQHAAVQQEPKGDDVASYVPQTNSMKNTETQHAASLQTEQKKTAPVSKETMPVASKPTAPLLVGNAVNVTVQPIASQTDASAAEASETTPETDNTPAVKAGSGVGSAEEHGLIMWAPNVIAPDSDVESNRNFRLKFNATVKEFHVYIYNRNGRQLYTSMDPAFEWDATYNGTKMPQGAYVWVAKFRDSDNKVHQEKGTVTIVR